MNNMGYLFAAYTAVWLILGFYLFVLILRNHKLTRMVNSLEKRLKMLEKEPEFDPPRKTKPS